MIGGALVKIAFVSCLLAILAYIQFQRKGDSRALLLARVFYHATAVSVILAAASLLYLILTHQFQYTYVWSYSSRALPTPLLISTFYAGQEGSFMLWTLFTTIIGVFLLSSSRAKGYEPQVMPVFALINLTLLLMLLVKSPFTTVWETWPGDVQAGFLPADGRGLNPLLQNYWMVIHPQVLFSGFAAMAVPYAYAAAGLLKREYDSWIRAATPWLVFGTLVLGTGIMLGGFWAYETLGWGGYWGWDPVENSSLVPWLISLATIHTMLSQRRNGSFIRTNLILSMLCFIAVLYSTFLTRSGVLGDTSVHSFVDPGMWVYWLLVGLLVGFIMLGAVIFLRRLKEIPRPSVPHTMLSRETALFLGASALVCAAVLITAGTSAPIITDLLQGKKSAIDISYYATTILPLGILMGFLAGLGQMLWWTRSSVADLLKALRVPLVLSVLTAAGILFSGTAGLPVALFVAGAVFSLLVNIHVGIRIFRGNPKYAAGAFAHIGVAVMFFGFVTSSEYDSQATVALPQGETVEALGYRLTYEGFRQLRDEKYAFDVRVEGGNRTFTVAPVMYYSAFNDGMMRNPDIANLGTKDFYLAPLALERPGTEAPPAEKSTFRPGDEGRLGGFGFSFLGFDRPFIRMAAGRNDDGEAGGRARFLVRSDGREPEILSIPLGSSQTLGDARYVVHADAGPEEAEGAVVVTVQDTRAGRDRDVLMVEASVKPWINLVWAGFIIMAMGLLVTVYRRAREAARRIPAPGEEPGPA